jgi:Zn-dependent protease
MIFNLLPFQPLDGSRLLPPSMDRMQAAIAPYSFFLLIVILNVPVLSDWIIAAPVRFVAGGLQALLRTPVVAGLGR